MCKAMEEMREEAAHDSRVKIAKAMLKDGLECQTVSKYSGLSPEEVGKLAAQKTV